MKFPAEFSTKVDLTAVNWDAMKPWVAKRVTELLGGLEDEVVISYVIEQLEGKKVGAANVSDGSTSSKPRCGLAGLQRRRRAALCARHSHLPGS